MDIRACFDCVLRYLRPNIPTSPMLQQIEQLCVQTDGRYATDAELIFFQDYLNTARLRFLLYQKMQKLEPQIIQKVLAELQTKEPGLLTINGQDLTAKWQRDTIRLLRYAATALLSGDAEVFEESLLMWFQTIMRSFQAERSCEATYRTMDKVLREMLSPDEAALFCPLIEMSQTMLGKSDAS